MADFEFIKNPVTGKWVIMAPRRAKRTNAGKVTAPICPFCIGAESDDEELFRVGGEHGNTNWHIRVIPNKFPFVAHHELIIHSPDHHKNFDELPSEQVELILQTYRQRFIANSRKGQVYLFHNRGMAAGESLPHPHTQLTVIPGEVKAEIPALDKEIYKQWEAGGEEMVETESFLIFCPKNSNWPDEVWVAPKKSGVRFGVISNSEVKDLASVLARLIQIFDLRHGHEFPFNFYIYPGKNWYLRIIPRMKILGGFELGTNIIVNTQDPKETLDFIKKHFWEPNLEEVKEEHQADYWKSV